MSVIISCHPFKLEKKGGLNVKNIAVGRLMIGRVPGENNKRWKRERERTGCAGVKAAAFRQSTEPRERELLNHFLSFLSCCCFSSSTRKNSCASFSRETTLGLEFIRRRRKNKRGTQVFYFFSPVGSRSVSCHRLQGPSNQTVKKKFPIFQAAEQMDT